MIQVKESKRQFIFDVVNKGGEKEKMELFVNFCEDTIFEMQLAAQISGSESGEELKAKDDNEEKDNVETNENLVEDSRCFSIRNIRKHIKRITIRNIISAIFSFFQNILVFITHAFLGLVWFCLYLLYHIFLSGWIIDVAKEINLADLLGDLRDPTMVEAIGVREGAVRENNVCHTVAFSSRTNLRGMSLDLSAVSRDPQLLTDIFGLCLKKEGGKYTLSSGDQHSSLDEFLNTSKCQVNSLEYTSVNLLSNMLNLIVFLLLMVLVTIHLVHFCKMFAPKVDVFCFFFVSTKWTMVFIKLTFVSTLNIFCSNILTFVWICVFSKQMLCPL